MRSIATIGLLVTLAASALVPVAPAAQAQTRPPITNEDVVVFLKSALFLHVPKWHDLGFKLQEGVTIMRIVERKLSTEVLTPRRMSFIRGCMIRFVEDEEEKPEGTFIRTRLDFCITYGIKHN
jgi:hypothetical protein